jgi:hypothetical protein
MSLRSLARIGDGPDPVLDARGAIVLARCRRTRSARDRLIGLLGTRALGPDEGLWIAPCRGVHTAFMRMPIACALLDADGLVLAVRDPLPPWRSLAAHGARAALECAPGGLARVAPGDRLVLAARDSRDRIVTPGG